MRIIYNFNLTGFVVGVALKNKITPLIHISFKDMWLIPSFNRKFDKVKGCYLTGWLFLYVGYINLKEEE